MATIFEATGILLGLIALALASVRWGYDSTERVRSPEWERRRAWRARYSASWKITPSVRRSPRRTRLTPWRSEARA